MVIIKTPTQNIWTRATIVRPLSDPHSYEVLGPTGTLRRTRHHIRPIPPDNTTTITATDNTPQAPAMTDYIYIPNVPDTLANRPHPNTRHKHYDKSTTRHAY